MNKVPLTNNFALKKENDQLCLFYGDQQKVTIPSENVSRLFDMFRRKAGTFIIVLEDGHFTINLYETGLSPDISFIQITSSWGLYEDNFITRSDTHYLFEFLSQFPQVGTDKIAVQVLIDSLELRLNYLKGLS